MPKVPLFERKVYKQPSQNVRVSTEAPQLNQGYDDVQKAAGNLASATRDMYLEEKQKADEIQVQAAYTELNKLKNDMLYNPENGAYTRKGADAIGLAKDFDDVYSTSVAEIEKKFIKNDSQRKAFAQLSERERRGVNGQLSKHTFQEIQRYDEEVTTNSVRASQEDAVANYHEGYNYIDSALDQQSSFIAAHAKRNGKPQEWITTAQKEASSKTVTKVIERMVNNDDDMKAKEAFQRYKDDLTPEDLVRVEKMVEAGSLRGESQRIVDDIMSQKQDFTESRELVKKLTKDDPKLRDEVEKRLRDEFGARKAAREEDRRVFFENIANNVEQTKQRPKASDWAELNLSQKNAIDARINQLRQGIEPETNWADYYNLVSMANNPQLRKKFLKTDLLIYRPKMADSEFKELVKLQKAARDGTSKLNYGFLTKKQLVDNYLGEIGVAKGSPGTAEFKKRATFYRKLDDMVAEFEESNGRKANRKELQAIVDHIGTMGTIVDGGWFWFDKSGVRRFETEDERWVPDQAPVPEKISFPVTVKKQGQSAVVSDKKELDEAMKEGWSL